MKYNDVVKQIGDLQLQIQEIQSTCYVVYPSGDDGFKFIAYLDLETLQMSYAIVDANMNSIEILTQIPVPVMIAFGAFMSAVEEWQADPEKEFPYAQYVGDFSEFVNLDEDATFLPTDHHYTGEEGRLV